MADLRRRDDWEDVLVGSRDAFARIFDEYHVTVYRYVWRMLGHEEGAEDIVQDVFITAWDKRESIRLVGHSVLPWLLTTARFKVANARRHEFQQINHEVGEYNDAVGVGDTPFDRVELRAMLSEVFDALSEEERAVVSLCLVDGVSYAAAADALQTSIGALRSRLSRAKRRMRFLIERLEGRAR